MRFELKGYEIGGGTERVISIEGGITIFIYTYEVHVYKCKWFKLSTVGLVHHSNQHGTSIFLTSADQGYQVLPWVLFHLQRSEMSENISLKMGVKFAASLNMGKNLC